MSYIFQVVATDIEGLETVIAQCWEGSEEADRWRALVDGMKPEDGEVKPLRYRTAYDLSEFDELNDRATDAALRAPTQGHPARFQPGNIDKAAAFVEEQGYSASEAYKMGVMNASAWYELKPDNEALSAEHTIASLHEPPENPDAQ